MISTAFVAPLKMKHCWNRYAIYTAITGFTWFFFGVTAMFWWPEPGIGVFILGLISWIFGTFIFLLKPDGGSGNPK
ncbi:MAG TPA: hypothetical protein VGO67_00465 [Verrucomicrobiae bacterium]|jgi:hypothetical protein